MRRRPMTGIIELNFKRPVKEGISEGGHFDATRHYGSHKGVDFLAPRGTDVKAVEHGKVVYSGMVDGSGKKTGTSVIFTHSTPTWKIGAPLRTRRLGCYNP